MAGVGVEFDLFGDDARRGQLRHHAREQAGREDAVGARQHIEDARADAIEERLDIEADIRATQDDQRVGVEAARPVGGAALDLSPTIVLLILFVLRGMLAGQ